MAIADVVNIVIIVVVIQELVVMVIIVVGCLSSRLKLCSVQWLLVGNHSHIYIYIYIYIYSSLCFLRFFANVSTGVPW